MKRAYKQLRKKLNKHFKYKYDFKNGYSAQDEIRNWITQCGIKCTDDHVRVLMMIHGGVFHPYQKHTRKETLKYFKRNKKYVEK